MKPKVRQDRGRLTRAEMMDLRKHVLPPGAYTIRVFGSFHPREGRLVRLSEPRPNRSKPDNRSG